MQVTGLTTTQAKNLLQQLGPNLISDGQKFSFFGLLFSEAFNFLNILLILAAAVSFFIGDLADALLIITIVLLNTGISFWQEYKAERTLEELKSLSRSYVRVIRDGIINSIDSKELVPGDLVMLEIGDKVPADARIVEANNFEVNESSLTGESTPVYKKTGPAEEGLVYAGTLAVAGLATIQISATGNMTRFGRIAQTLKTIQDTETPLQNQIKHLALNVALIALAISSLIFVFGLLSGNDLVTMFLTAVSAAVAAIPEGLPAIILVTLAVGVKRMALKKAVVRKMVAVEALGAVQVICTDKTGTLTRGEMAVGKIWFDNQLFTPAEFHHRGSKLPHASLLLDAMILPNTASLVYQFDHQTRSVLGDSTEGALLMFAESQNINYEVHKNGVKILDRFNFDQIRKSMSVVVEREGKIYAFAKSAPEFMISHATRQLQGGRPRLIDESMSQQLTKTFQNLSQSGYRVLGLGYKELAQGAGQNREDVESDLVLLGFVALRDPIREEAKDAIKLARSAGIITVMVTGDNELTAKAVGKELELAEDGDEIITGKDLEKINDEQLADLIWKIKIFARTNPEDKLRIVKAFQAAGVSVAVTGDGVNDALALKQAEIGVAMGKTGTDVAKEAADIIITDDNYATIVKAVEEGRTIYDNVLISIRYLLSTNISELMTILIALLLHLPSPLLPAQILWINLVSDGLPAIALALDPKDPLAMKRPPRSRSHKLLDYQTLMVLLVIGLITAIGALAVYWHVLKSSENLTLARTWTFTVLIFAQMLVAFLIRGRKKAFNKKLAWAVAITLIVQLIILFSPTFHAIFKIQSPF